MKSFVCESDKVIVHKYFFPLNSAQAQDTMGMRLLYGKDCIKSIKTQENYWSILDPIKLLAMILLEVATTLFN